MIRIFRDNSIIGKAVMKYLSEVDCRIFTIFPHVKLVYFPMEAVEKAKEFDVLYWSKKDESN